MTWDNAANEQRNARSGNCNVLDETEYMLGTIGLRGMQLVRAQAEQKRLARERRIRELRSAPAAQPLLNQDSALPKEVAFLMDSATADQHESAASLTGVYEQLCQEKQWISRENRITAAQFQEELAEAREMLRQVREKEAFYDALKLATREYTDELRELVLLANELEAFLADCNQRSHPLS